MNISYKERMQKKKSYIDSRIKAANIKKGIIVLLTGNGKGKSSSAMGMICRSLGYNLKVVLVRFLKGEKDTGEDLFLNKHKNVKKIIMATGFTWETQNKELDKKEALKTWNKAKIFLQDPTIDLIVFDELTYMINYNYLKESDIFNLLKQRPNKQNIIITGRAANKSLIELADTVSEVNNVKHAFDNNIKSQKGIDY